MGVRLVLVLAVALVGCDGDLLLNVDVRTDLVPGAEFAEVRTEVVNMVPEGAPEMSQSARLSVRAEDDFFEGRRVAEFELPAPDTYLVRASLLAADGSIVLSRRTRVRVDETFGLTLVLTRTCTGVSCPGPADDAELTECLGGRCVAPDCNPINPAACGAPQCSDHDECSSTVSCAAGRCIDGFCLTVPIFDACAAGQWCSVELGGCVGLPAGDAGVECVPEAEACNGADDDCDGTTDEGFDLDGDPSNCGTCGTVCGDAHATATCTGGACTLTCDSGYEDCNGVPDDGCEADLATPGSCGDCSATCNDPTPLCVMEGSAFSCASSCPPESPTLCGASCVNTDDSLTHCGGCGSPCDPAAATGACNAGTCAIESCDANREDCDGNVATGCEADLTDPATCGACGTSCGGSAPFCRDGGSGFACTDGCNDGVRGDDETDVDCGGSLCGPCDDGQMCDDATDCAGTLVCSAGRCTACGECEPGAMETVSCGNCGSRSRTCTAMCIWGSFSSCSGEGVCAPGSTDSQSCGNCGTRTRTCNGSCAWGSFGSCTGEGPCAPGAMDTQSCGNCGTQSRSCDGTCQWGSFGSCTGEGVCSPGSTTNAGCPGACMVKTCDSICQWGTVCNGCSSSCSSSYTQCGTTCTTSGYHASSLSCSTSCGGSSCISAPDNRASCARSCGSSFSACGTSCPAGYYASSLSCSTSCTSATSCISAPDNRATCNLVQGTSFSTCGLTCPSGYYVASRSCSTNCTSATSCISAPDNRSTCNLVQGSSFNACGSTCPAGYTVSSRFCTTSCTSATSCISAPDNAVRCTRI